MAVAVGWIHLSTYNVGNKKDNLVSMQVPPRRPIKVNGADVDCWPVSVIMKQFVQMMDHHISLLSGTRAGPFQRVRPIIVFVHARSLLLTGAQ